MNPETAQQLGLIVVSVQETPVQQAIATTATIQANENRVFHINSFVGGRVARDMVMLGDTVRQGQVLAYVQNLEVAKIQAEYIHQLHQNEVDIAQARQKLALAQRNLQREQRLLAEGISPRKDYYQAQTEAELARIQLEGQQEHHIHIQDEGRALLSAYNMKPSASHTQPIKTMTPVIAPRAGVVIRKTITVGDVVTPETVMLEVADLSTVWLNITVYPRDVAHVKRGQAVAFRPDTLPGEVFTGRIDYLPPIAGQATPTFIARAFMDNRNGRLKPGIFGQAVIYPSTGQRRPFVPVSAVQRLGENPANSEVFVFTEVKPGHYRKQTVTLSGQPGESNASPQQGQTGYWVASGLKPGDRVVTHGSFTLKAAWLKTRQNGEAEE